MTTPSHKALTIGAHPDPHVSLAARFALFVVSLAAFTSSWTAVAFAGSNVTDYFLSLSIVAVLFAWAVRALPIFVQGWMLAPLLAGLGVVLFDLLSGQGSSAWLTMLLRIFFSTTAVVVLLTSMSAISKSSVVRVLRFWCAGVVVSAAVSVAQSLHLISLTGFLDQPTGDRFSGLTSHPNSLAYGIVLALPAAMFLAKTDSGRWRAIWLIGVVFLGWGLVLSGSRAGLIVGIPVLLASIVSWLWSPRRQLLVLPLLILGGIALYLWLPSALESTRLVQGAADSDLGRRDFNTAALEVFLSSPLIGGGFGQMQGVSVPLMVLSAGGIVLALAYYVFAFRELPALSSHRASPAARMGIICLFAFIGFSLLNPVWMERSTYWSIFAASLVVGSARDLSDKLAKPAGY